MQTLPLTQKPRYAYGTVLNDNYATGIYRFAKYKTSSRRYIIKWYAETRTTHINKKGNKKTYTYTHELIENGYLNSVNYLSTSGYSYELIEP